MKTLIIWLSTVSQITISNQYTFISIIKNYRWDISLNVVICETTEGGSLEDFMYLTNDRNILHLFHLFTTQIPAFSNMFLLVKPFVLLFYPFNISQISVLSNAQFQNFCYVSLFLLFYDIRSNFRHLQSCIPSFNNFTICYLLFLGNIFVFKT